MPRRNKNNQNNVRVGEGLKIAVEVAFKKFLNTEELKEWEFPSSFTASERAYVHMEARKQGLKSKSRGKGSARYLTVYKREGSAIMQKDATVNLTQISRTFLTTLLTRYAVSAKERQDCLPPVERCKDVYQDGKDSSRALGRISVGSPQVPPPANKPMTQFRCSLPVYSQMETIVQTISDNPVTIITGQTGSGKTTQIPQYLLEWHERTGRPCMIICSQPRRIAAVSVAERVAAERGEKLGQSIGYQIRLEGKISAFTVLMYCTSGVLLRSLMSAESMLASVTHVIIDEIHERDRLSDFTLIVLREALSKYRSLRLVLMSATLDAKQFSAYFNNCPIIPVPGKQFEVKEYFLEDILKQTGYMNAEMEKFRKQLEKRRAQKAALDKWTAVMQGTSDDLVNDSPQIDANTSNTEMDAALFEAWTNGTESAFAQVIYIIQSEAVGVDYQHSDTGVTALMVAAARGSLETVEQLLCLGANVYVRSSNDYTALDWAKHLSRQEISDTLEAYALNFEQNTTAVKECEKGNKKLSDADMEMLELYSNAANDDVIDYKLILTLISNIHLESNNKGGILVFLPGYSEINTLKEIIMAESNRLNQKSKIILLMLHSNMQTSMQRLVFRPTPPNARKVILSTNIAETSLTIEDVIYVIDTGKVKEKSYNALTGASQLSTIWISKSSALQRKGRAGRVQAGVCYRLYSTLRYEAMNPKPLPEILRTPLSELCLFAKQLAPPNTSIVDFLMRAIDPPSIVASRSAVALLKTIDALDTWEDLTDLGHHLLDLPVDPRYGKMLIYAVVLKCLDPVLTIVCCLSYKEIFTLPEANSDRKKMASDRSKFSNGSLSDHMVLLKVFQAWQEAKKQGRDKQFCYQNCVNGANMEMIMGTRAQVLAQLRASGFIKSKAPLDIKYVNSNSDNWAVVKAALIGGLYPNIARIDREHKVIRTVKEHKVRVHATSVLTENASSKKKVVEGLPSDWIIYEELTKVGQQSYIRTATVVSPITVAVFAGPAKIPFDAYSDSQLEGSIGSDSEEEDVGPNQTATLKVDDWATFRTDSEAAQLALQLRIKWHSLLAKKLRLNKVLNYMEEMVINTIVKVLSAEEQALGLIHPPGVGKRPYLMTPNTVSSGRMDFSDTDSNISLLGSEVNQPNRNRSSNSASPAKNFERFNCTSKNFDDSTTPLVESAIETLRSNCASPFRYFVIKAGIMKNIELSFVHKMWSFLPMTQNRIVQAHKGGKTVLLVFSIQGSNHFQGYARLTSDMPVSPESIPPELIPGSLYNPPLPIEWIKRSNVPHHATRHIFNPYNEYAEVLMSRDGQEIEPSVGEMLLQLLDGHSWSNNSYFQRGPRVNRALFNNYK
ncbi:probable ATP-dependent RNA helicase YTHDC2 isoform X2 [Cimex lectularius]|uniref:RNA helicase n=1 Tax=Cimex lectularius TaxID=79782 RepID=A0A8I6TJC0_CIMLE|nr:probable ATP-dependent RNA helicase YTHDC2 isoform X2 [Cimex lectularius]